MVARKHLTYLILLLFPLHVLFLNVENGMMITTLALVASVVIYFFSVQRPMIYPVVLGVIAYGIAISMNATAWVAPAMTGMVLGWLSLIIILLGHVISVDDIKSTINKIVALDRNYLLIVGAITLLGFCLRWFQFTETPVLSSDEASAALFGMTYFDGTFNNPFISGWLEVPSMSFLLQGVSVFLFGNTVFALRIQSVLVGTALIPLVMWASRPLVSRPFQVIAGLVIATCGLMLNFSRIGIVIVNDCFWAVLLLGVMLHSAKIVSTRTSILLGVFTGIAQFGYASARGFALMLIVWYGLGLIHTPNAWKNALTQLVLCGSVALAVSSPLMAHYYQRPDNFRAPLQRASLILPDSPDGSSVLSRQSSELNMSPAAILMSNFKISFLAFVTGPVDGWYRSNSPILSLGFSSLFVLGLITCLVSWRSQSLQIAVVVVVLACISASLSYPIAAGHRMLNAMGAIAIIIAIGAQTVYQIIVPRVAAMKWAVVALLTVAVGYSVLLGPYLYYSTFVTVEDGLGDGSMQIASQFGKYAQRLPAGTKIDVYELDYFSRGSTPVIDFLTKKLDYLAISGDTQPRPDAQLLFVPMERVPNVHIPDTYKKQIIKSINGDDLIVVGIAPTFLP